MYATIRCIVTEDTLSALYARGTYEPVASTLLPTTLALEALEEGSIAPRPHDSGCLGWPIRLRWS